MAKPPSRKSNLDQLPVPESWDEHWEHAPGTRPGLTVRQWLGLVAVVATVGFVAGLITEATR